MSAGRTLRSYLWWTYDRGSFHYDVMVTIILAFIFIAPRFIDFRDKPPASPSHPSPVMASRLADGTLLYTVDASDLPPASSAGDRDLSLQLQRAIEPVAGQVRVTDYTPVTDSAGHVSAYRVRARRP